jgi:hypothetical protein
MAQMDWINLLQWPAMAITVLAAWLVGAQRKHKRSWGFWFFLMGNGLWIIWGLYDKAFALVFLQVCLAVLNIRGGLKNQPG